MIPFYWPTQENRLTSSSRPGVPVLRVKTQRPNAGRRLIDILENDGLAPSCPDDDEGYDWVIHVVVGLPACGAGLVAADAKLAEVTIHGNTWIVLVNRAAMSDLFLTCCEGR